MKKQHQRALRLSGVRPFVLYALRHTFLTRLGEAGCDAWTLARIAGHSSISMSARYVHPSEDAVMNVFSRLQTRKERKRPEFLSITHNSGRVWLVIDGSYAASRQILTL